MADKVAFALKETVKDFAGGSIAIGAEGRTLDVKSRLDNGDGQIVVTDEAEVAALRGFEALKEVPVSSGSKSAKSEGGSR